MILRENTQDVMAFLQVYGSNEYALPERFGPDDMVIDLGAQIGSFAIACFHRGCQHIECYEPEPMNFGILAYNMGPYMTAGRALIVNAAVWRSDRDEPVHLFVADGPCTAMHQVSQVGLPVTTLKLDDILRKFETVKLLKIDVEGSEYPILFTSKELHRVQRIVGEIHLKLSYADFPWASNVEGVTAFLEEQGFTVDLLPGSGHPNFVALFSAARPVVVNVCRTEELREVMQCVGQ